MKTLKDVIDEEMKDHEFKKEYKEYEDLEPEIVISQFIIEARKELGLTQKQLAERSGITQADISRLENGNANPSIRTLKKLAAALNRKLKIEFVPVNKVRHA